MKPTPLRMKAAALMLAGLGACMAASSANAYEDGPYCREFTQNIVVGGQVKQGYGTACLQPNGAWQVVSQQNEVTPQVAEVLPTVQYIEQPAPILVQRADPMPFPVFLSFGYSYSDGHGWRGGRGGGWHGGGRGGHGGGYHR